MGSSSTMDHGFRSYSWEVGSPVVALAYGFRMSKSPSFELVGCDLATHGIEE